MSEKYKSFQFRFSINSINCRKGLNKHHKSINKYYKHSVNKRFCSFCSISAYITLFLSRSHFVPLIVCGNHFFLSSINFLTTQILPRKNVKALLNFNLLCSPRFNFSIYRETQHLPLSCQMLCWFSNKTLLASFQLSILYIIENIKQKLCIWHKYSQNSYFFERKLFEH